MTEWPSSATRQSRKCSAEQGRGHPCSQPRLSWQGLGLILMQINLCMSCQCLRQKKSAETASSHTWVQGATTSELRHCWVLLLTHHLRYSPCSPAAGDRNLIFHADTLPDRFLLFFPIKVNPRAAGLDHFQVLQPGISTERADNANGFSKGFFHDPSDL